MSALVDPFSAPRPASSPRFTPPTQGALKSIPMGRQLAEERLVGRFIHVAGLGWYRWDGACWRDLGAGGEDEVAAVAALWAEEFIVGLVRSAASDDVIKSALRYREEGQVRTLVRAARLADGIRVPADRLDANPYLLGCPNGTVDLRSGLLLPADPHDLITKNTAVNYVPGARHPDWEAALQAVPDGAREFLRTRLGQALIGEPAPDDEIVLATGGGENGKTAMIGTACSVVGDYGILISDRVILGSHDQHPTELMDLRGARLAYIEETPEARRLDVARLKRIVGTEEITARRIAKDPVTFAPTHTLIVLTNYVPTVDETDHGTWRRLKRVTFPYTFRKRPEDVVTDTDRLGDRTLKARLRRNQGPREAALAWLVSGAVSFLQAGGIHADPPLEVIHATEEWRAEGDLLGAFLAETCALDSSRCVLVVDLHQAMAAWLDANGFKRWSSKTIKSRIQSHHGLGGRIYEDNTRDLDGLSRRDTATSWSKPARARVWRGVRFLAQHEPGAASILDMLHRRSEPVEPMEQVVGTLRVDIQAEKPSEIPVPTVPTPLTSPSNTLRDLPEELFAGYAR